MEKKNNFFDQYGNYINIENLSLAEIYLRASQEGYKKGYIDGSLGINRTSEGISKTADNLYDKLMKGGLV